MDSKESSTCLLMDNRQLWLFRHGATEWARQGRHTGSTDLPLLQEGEAEARALAPVLKGVKFAAVYSSPLQRAQRTCALSGLSKSPTILSDLSEWNYGNYEGITTKEIRQTVPNWTVWNDGCPDGEEASAVQLRCRRVIEQCLDFEGSGDIALFAHGHILRALTGTWLGLGAAGGRLFKLTTGSICILGFEREQRVITRWNAHPADRL